MEREKSTENVVQLPFAIASRRVIAKLLQAGYLEHAKRHDAKAIKSALTKLRLTPIDIFGRPEEDNEPPPAA
jgi:hypothetical protein